MELKTYFAQDLNGNVIPGATVYLYLPGTTTLAAGLMDVSHNPLPNPFKADVNGKIALAAPDGEYDLRVVSAGRDQTHRIQFLDTTEAIDTVTQASLRAGSEADRAELEAIRAEEARDAANLSSGIYPDTASGLAATSEGDYFSVPGSNAGEYLILYRHDAGGTASEHKRYPSTLAVKKSLRESKTSIAHANGQGAALDDYAYGITDEDDILAFGINKSGDVAHGDVDLLPGSDVAEHVWGVVDQRAKRLLIGILRNGLLSAQGLELGASDWAPREFAMTDADGVPAWKVDNDGRVTLNLSDGTSVAAAQVASVMRHIKRDAILPDEGDTFMHETVSTEYDRVLSDVNGITRPYLTRNQGGAYIFDTDEPIEFIGHNGQSLQTGGGAGSAEPGNEIYNAEPPNAQNCLMLNTGMRGRHNTDNRPTEDVTDFSPAVEEYSGSTQGETQGSGLMAWLYRTSQIQGERAPVLLYRAFGQGATSIVDLDKEGSVEGDVYPDSIFDIQEAVRIAGLYGKQIKMNFICWTHGQADVNMPYADYKAYLIQLANDYDADIQAILPEGNGAVNMVISQVGASRYAGSATSEVQLAQLDAAIENPNMFVSTPEYIFMKIDNTHLRPREYSVLGEYQAKAIRSIKKTGDWEPLRPLNATLDQQTVRIEFNVPVGGLVFDTDLLPFTANYGFEYVDDDSSAEIRSVRIVSHNTIDIRLSKVPSGANPIIRYARTGTEMPVGFLPSAWGNLRDQDESMSFMEPGRRLYNWCVNFELSL